MSEEPLFYRSMPEEIADELPALEARVAFLNEAFDYISYEGLNMTLSKKALEGLGWLCSDLQGQIRHLRELAEKNPE